jgi:hypothetical protein
MRRCIRDQGKRIPATTTRPLGAYPRRAHVHYRRLGVRLHLLPGGYTNGHLERLCRSSGRRAWYTYPHSARCPRKDGAWGLHPPICGPRHSCYPILVHKFEITQGEQGGQQLNALESKSPLDLAYFSREEDGEHGAEHSAAQRRIEKREERREKREKTLRRKTRVTG